MSNTCPWCYGPVEDCNCTEMAAYYDGMSPAEMLREQQMMDDYAAESEGER